MRMPWPPQKMTTFTLSSLRSTMRRVLASSRSRPSNGSAPFRLSRACRRPLGHRRSVVSERPAALSTTWRRSPAHAGCRGQARGQARGRRRAAGGRSVAGGGRQAVAVEQCETARLAAPATTTGPLPRRLRGTPQPPQRRCGPPAAALKDTTASEPGQLSCPGQQPRHARHPPPLTASPPTRPAKANPISVPKWPRQPSRRGRSASPVYPGQDKYLAHRDDRTIQKPIGRSCTDSAGRAVVQRAAAAANPRRLLSYLAMMSSGSGSRSLARRKSRYERGIRVRPLELDVDQEGVRESGRSENHPAHARNRRRPGPINSRPPAAGSGAPRPNAQPPAAPGHA
jgi:hypothetical protein